MAYTVTINIANRGTQTSSGPSKFGHMWYETSDGEHSKSYGFGPDPSAWGLPFWKEGKTNNNDSDTYLSTDHTRIIEITKEQYDKLNDFGNDPYKYGFDHEYRGWNNSCVDFTWKGMHVAGLNDSQNCHSVILVILSKKSNITIMRKLC